MGIIFLTFIAGGFLIWFGLGWFETSHLYYPSRDVVAVPTDMGMAYEKVVLLTNDNVRIHGWYIPATKPDSFTIIYCHGNGGNITHRVDKIKNFHSLGLNVFAFDYRGYGKSSGSPSEKGTYEDAEAAYQYVTGNRGVAPKRVVIYGESLGGAVATELTFRHEAAGLVLESPFTSTVQMANRIFPWLTHQWIIRNKYDSLSKIKSIKAPLLILHSLQDEIVPFDMGETLFKEAQSEKKLIRLTGSHNDGYLVSGATYLQALDQFISERNK